LRVRPLGYEESAALTLGNISEKLVVAGRGLSLMMPSLVWYSVPMIQFVTALLALALSACGSSSDSGGCTQDDCGRCEADRVGVKICSFVSTPTVSESVTVANYGAGSVNLQGYTLWDKNATSNGSGQFTFQSSDVVSAGGRLTVATSRLGFQINDSGETITLKDSGGSTIDSKSN
jgi:hypothetical protein